jgi:FtsZ-binding cell division protein ZapB
MIVLVPGESVGTISVTEMEVHELKDKREGDRRHE